MIPPSIQLKINRANEHRNTLIDKLTEYLDSPFYRLSIKRNPCDDTSVVCIFDVIHEPPLECGVILGDFLHNIRSALDYFACCLVEKNGGIVNDRTQFPIIDSTPPKPLYIACDAGPVEPKVLTFIDSLQPYHRGDNASSHPLSILNYLSNRDKHRLLQVAVVGAIGHGFRLVLPDGRTIDPEPSIGMAYNNAPIAIFRPNEAISSLFCGEVDMYAVCPPL